MGRTGWEDNHPQGGGVNFDPNRFRPGRVEVRNRGDDCDGIYRDLVLVDSPWLKEQRDRGNISWSDAAEAEAAQMRQQPYAVKIGDLEFSTSTALVTWPYVIWDVNAYYAQLGVNPRATKTEIRDAYFARKGYLSERLTYIVKQLLDAKVRRDYDGCQPGSVFFDKYVAEYVKHKAMEQHRMEYGRTLSFEEQVDEGLEQLDLADIANSEIKLSEVDLDGRHSPVVGSKWKWGYYLWKTSSYDIDKLAAWQQSLCVAFGKDPRRLAVGLMGGEAEAQIIKVGYHSVAFINVNADPTPILARTLINTEETGDD